MARRRRLRAIVTPLLALAGLVAGAGALPADAAAWAGEPPARCVSRAALEEVQVGMTLAQARGLLHGRAVWWGPERGVWSQSYPRACSSTRAMLIQADDGRITFVVNAGERRDATCTTAAEFDQLRDGMTRARADHLLRGKQFDLKRSDEWQPVPCQGWSTQQVTFRGGRVATHVRGFYFG
ncbi:hypothetical protein SAMN04488543_0104 [Friedmanniella luteola]|uniref:Uncharacterized protein n=1 Tax=Friedmanniella luteola TaxID=546871 RepID=A0A1H1L5V1_9ACTN|nr:hypothetical protein [Friedmanniella luteola]SDR69918.1 hypothetical protein SAMN04488543_0104 [Friedmanniella luteola]